jgi:hypothetical protein
MFDGLQRIGNHPHGSLIAIPLLLIEAKIRIYFSMFTMMRREKVCKATRTGGNDLGFCEMSKRSDRRGEHLRPVTSN